MSVGPTELLLIALVVFLLFGTRRLGDLGKGLGEGIRNFKNAIGGEPERDKGEPPSAIKGSGVDGSEEHQNDDKKAERK
jgi:sec-independent protein translocase protein TatA